MHALVIFPTPNPAAAYEKHIGHALSLLNVRGEEMAKRADANGLSCGIWGREDHESVHFW